MVCVQQQQRAAEDDEHDGELDADKDATEGSGAWFPFALQAESFDELAASIGGNIGEQRLGRVDALEEFGLDRGLQAGHEKAPDGGEDEPGDKAQQRANE